jgi:hypothetical protein
MTWARIFMNRIALALAAFLAVGACMALWAQGICGTICPITNGSGSCVPQYNSSSEDDTCLGCGNAIAKSVSYHFTWPDNTPDSLNASGNGQWMVYYNDCDQDACYNYGPVTQQCWPQFDNPVQSNGLFSVNTTDQGCSPSYLPLCGFCSPQQPKSVTCSPAPAPVIWKSTHQCQC